MDATLVTRLAKEARQHELSLQWAQIHLLECLADNEQRIAALRSRDSDADAQTLQLENEALALVLEAVRRAYPAGADIDV